MNDNNNSVIQLINIEDNGSRLTVIPMTDEEWEKLAFEKPYYSDDENLQKKFEFAVKMTGFGNVLSTMCKEFNDESLKRFIEKYFEDNELWTDYKKD